ncbi:hypothetical protein LZD49_07245 [Dyadobacter sp. CY261]|uniref:hypothetical protein n=1 Tax=Dyadobacter sp. CY261 TaxID=2907203 RepID=UPI001F29E75C|nr:hypothetical protein [Dyadobacter sp. CY261]MCF0070261.1 hypothetical protein [Dyadobacter sp. CY261]
MTTTAAPKVKGTSKLGEKKFSLNVNSKEFLKACNIAAKAIDPRPIVPAFGYIKIDVESGQMTLCGSNSKHLVTTTLSCDEKSAPYSFLFPSELGLKLLRSLPDTSIEISQYQNNGWKDVKSSGGVSSIQFEAFTIRIECGGNSYQLETENPADFTIPKLSGEFVEIFLPLAELSKSIFYCKDSVAEEGKSQEHLEGILVAIQHEELIVASSDNVVLVERRVPVRNDDNLDARINVPIAFASLLPVCSGEIACLKIYDDSIEVTDNVTTVRVMLRNVQFPAYEAMLPTSFATKASTTMDSLGAAISRSTLFANQVSGLAKLSIQDNGFTVDVPPGVYSNESSESVEMTHFEGSEMGICLNCRKVNDILGKISGGGNVLLNMNGRMKAILVLPESDPGLKILVIPIDEEKAP